jgi:hypothetical protein
VDIAKPETPGQKQNVIGMPPIEAALPEGAHCGPVVVYWAMFLTNL